MTLKLKRHPEYSSRVSLKVIHGKFPYKYYFEILGTNTIGKYIALVSKKSIDIAENDRVILEIDTVKLKGINTSNSYNAIMVNPVHLKSEVIYVYEQTRR